MAVKRIITTKPKVVVCSPPCSLFSILQNLNIAVHVPEWEKQFQLDREKGDAAHQLLRETLHVADDGRQILRV